MRTNLVAGVAFVVVAALAVHSYMPGASATSSAPRHAPTPTPPRSDRAVAGSATHPSLGVQAIEGPVARRYRLVSKTDLALQDKASPPERVSQSETTREAPGKPTSGAVIEAAPDRDDLRLSAELRGQVQVTEVEDRNGATVVQLVVTDAEVATRQYSGRRLVTSDTSRLDDMDRPFYALYDVGGGLSEVYVPPGTPLEQRNTMRTVAAALQVSPPPADRGAWSSREIVGGVAVEMRYRERVPGVYDRHFETDERAGRAAVTLRSGRLAELRGEESVTSAALGMAGTGSISIELVDETPNPNAVQAWAADRASAVTAGVATEVDRAAARRATVTSLDDGTSATDLLAMLESTTGDDDGRRGRVYLMRRLAARFELHPHEAALAAEALPELDADDAATVIGALSSVDSDETEAALAKVVTSDDTPAELVADAANALSFHETPGDTAIGALRQLADSDQRDRRGPGLLGLGSVSFRLGENHDPRSDDLVRDLLARFAAAGNEQERADLLAALGNTGSALILPAIEATLANGTLRLRHEAVVALRLVRSPRADQLLADNLGLQQPLDLRLGALFAARFRPLDALLPALANLLRHDPEPRARADAIELAGDRLSETAAVRSLLEWAAERDPDDSLRTRARELLSQT